MMRQKKRLPDLCLWGVILIGMILWIGLSWAAEYAELHFSKGVLRYNEGKFEEALQELSRAAELEPKVAETHYYLGLVQSHRRDFPASIAAFQQALALNPSLDEVHYGLGVAYFNQGDYPRAIQELRLAEAYEPNRAMVPFYLGYAYYLTKELDRSLPYFTRARELDAGMSQNAYFFSGMAYWGLERFDEAEKSFQAAVDTDPETDLAVAARRYIGSIEERKRRSRRWSLRTNLGLQYDDNVSLEPTEDSVFPQGFEEDEEDFRPVFFLTGQYKLLEGWGWESALRYTFYQSIHSSLHEFDYQNHQGILSASRQGKVREMPYQLSLDYDYGHSLLDQARYLDRQGVGGVFSLVEGARHLTQVQYRFRNQDFHSETPRPPFNRDSDNHSWGVTQFLFASDRARYVKLGYAFDLDRADGDNWDYRGHRILFGLQTPLWKSLRGNAEFAYHPQDYSHPHTLFRKKRRDKEYDYSLGLEWEPSKGLVVSLGYLRRSHDSNIALYDYDREVFSFGLAWGF